MNSLSIPGMKAISEANEVLGTVPERHRGLSFHRTVSSFSPDEISRGFELAFATTWARWNDPSIQKEILLSILCRKSESPKYPNGLRRIKRRDQLVAASVIQWLGTRMGEAFLREAFREAGGSCAISYPPEE